MWMRGVHVYTHIYMHVYTNLYLHVCNTHTHIHLHMRACLSARKHLHMYKLKTMVLYVHVCLLMHFPEDSSMPMAEKESSDSSYTPPESRRQIEILPLNMLRNVLMQKDVAECMIREQITCTMAVAFLSAIVAASGGNERWECQWAKGGSRKKDGGSWKKAPNPFPSRVWANNLTWGVFREMSEVSVQQERKGLQKGLIYVH